MKMSDSTLTTRKIDLPQAVESGGSLISGKRKRMGYIQDERLAKSLIMMVIGLLTIGCGVFFGLVIMAASGSLETLTF